MSSSCVAKHRFASVSKLEQLFRQIKLFSVKLNACSSISNPVLQQSIGMQQRTLDKPAIDFEEMHYMKMGERIGQAFRKKRVGKNKGDK